MMYKFPLYPGRDNFSEDRYTTGAGTISYWRGGFGTHRHETGNPHDYFTTLIPSYLYPESLIVTKSNGEAPDV